MKIVCAGQEPRAAWEFGADPTANYNFTLGKGVKHARRRHAPTNEAMAKAAAKNPAGDGPATTC